jgi:DinB family protein
MSIIETAIRSIQFNRPRTLATLDKIEQEQDPLGVLGWRPGPGRAHIAWQLMHLGITEELFATERLVPGARPQFTELVPRFRGGSTPDDQIPAPADIRRVLGESREHLLATLRRFSDADLAMTPQTLPERLREQKFTLRDILSLLSWHEAHHQGQAHITLNPYKARSQ